MATRLEKRRIYFSPRNFVPSSRIDKLDALLRRRHAVNVAFSRFHDFASDERSKGVSREGRIIMTRMENGAERTNNPPVGSGTLVFFLY